MTLFHCLAAPSLTALSLTAANADPALDAHLEANGGAAAFERQSSIRIEIEVSEPGFTVRGDYQATRDGQMRVDIFAGEDRVFTEALAPDDAWQMFADGSVADVEGEGRDALLEGITGHLYGLHEYASLGHSVETGGWETIDGVSYPVIDVVYASGKESRRYLDPETLLMTRERSEYALHPDIDPTQDRFETHYSDYREVDGVWRAFHTRKINLRTSEVAQTVQVLGIEVNPDLDPATFERPLSD